ncbi:Rz1 family lipoprotein [Sodalis endosymbiont of Spalangia cameroni]
MTKNVLRSLSAMWLTVVVGCRSVPPAPPCQHIAPPPAWMMQPAPDLMTPLNDIISPSDDE